jgi:putative glutamine amidotransferase
MSRRPAIGVPTQTLQAIDGIPEGLPHSWVMNHRYLTALAEAGAAPSLIPLLEDQPAALRALYDRLDGVFIAGGVDVDPCGYGEAVHPLLGRTDPSRDRVELQFTRWALADGKPLLGVCRGLHVLNVASGGTLFQDCADQIPGAIKHDYFPTEGWARDHLAHEVTLQPGSRLAEIFGDPAIRVNSMHHQAVQRLGAGLVSTAHASDGVVEAVERPDHPFMVGVQWHAEMLVDRAEGDRRLFTSFIAAAADWAARNPAR